jgi:hypothetical protein
MLVLWMTDCIRQWKVKNLPLPIQKSLLQTPSASLVMATWLRASLSKFGQVSFLMTLEWCGAEQGWWRGLCLDLTETNSIPVGDGLYPS